MFIDPLHIVLVSEGREILAVCGWSSNLKLLGLGIDFVRSVFAYICLNSEALNTSYSASHLVQI